VKLSRSELRGLGRKLSKHLPVRAPVEIRRWDRGADGHRHCDRRPNGTFVITLNTRPLAYGGIETLCHEWCHARTWAEWVRGAAHGPLWGAEMAKVERLWAREGEFAE